MIFYVPVSGDMMITPVARFTINGDILLQMIAMGAKEKKTYLWFLKVTIMNWIDLLIVIILILSAIMGFIHGLIKEVASLAALILGIWGAIRFSAFTAGKLYEIFDMSGQYVGIVAFIITFAVIVVLVHFTGIVTEKLVHAVALGFVNRLLGIAFGLMKSALIMSVIFVILNSINDRKHFLPEETIEESVLYDPVSGIAPLLFPVIEEGNFNLNIDRFKNESEGVFI